VHQQRHALTGKDANQRKHVIRWGEVEREQLWADFGKQFRDNISLQHKDVKPVFDHYPLARDWTEIKDKHNNQRRAMKREFEKNGTPWPQEFIPKSS
jgi:hypothetical protein